MSVSNLVKANSLLLSQLRRVLHSKPFYTKFTPATFEVRRLKAWLLLENTPFKNLWRINCLDWNFVQCGRIRFALAKIMNKLNSTKNQVFISLVGPSETGKLQPFYNWLKIGRLQPKFDKIYFLSTFPPSLRCYAKGNWNSRICSWSKLWIYWFVKKQR